MARPESDFPSAAAIRALADNQGRLAVSVTPGARAQSIALGQGVLMIKVRTKPEHGKANAAALILIAEALGIATSRLRMLRGATGRSKLVQLD